ncbi:DNA-binding MarR family transcriptional regulator [Sagittula marina]|uniref:DNA-binding MarR family transcriptional regulator n=1 Tax=Sagittula marina TaxID=943940 RepID=A0A7W6DQJ4_9RHOB|nr:MarR family transcriptional regulator [Sagittula marina]MBB3987366.1 DNA-binding MarR family transcriptional regulator [Sagittula marina]
MTSDDHIMRDVADMQEPDALSGSVSYRIRLLQIAAYKSFEQKVSGFGAAPRYFGLLKLVQANPGIPQTRLAEAIFLDRSSLVPIIETLTREGWVERKPSAQDKRVRRVFLTDDGAERLVALERCVAEHEAAITAGLTKRQKASLLSLLDHVAGNLRRTHDGGA